MATSSSRFIIILCLVVLLVVSQALYGLHFVRSELAFEVISAMKQSEVTNNLILLQRNECSHEQFPSILYIIRSFPGRYADRLSLQARSWMFYLDPEREGIFVASLFSPGWTQQKALAATNLSQIRVPVHFSTPGCAENNRGVGLCCQEAQALMNAASQMDGFEWVFVIDEDVFVHPGLLRKIAFNQSLNEAVAVGTWGCGVTGAVGFCGGGGYLISQHALQRLVAVPNFYEV